MSDLRSFFDAAGVFFNELSNVRLGPLAFALGFYLLNLLLRSYAWWSILRAAYPGTRYRWRPATGAYLAGVGVNAVSPARGGDLVKLYLVRARMSESTTATVLATLLVETLLDVAIGSALLLFAITQGVFPSLPNLPSLPAFEWSWAVQHPRITGAVAGALALIALLLVRRAARAARDFWQRVRQGFAILHTPRRWAVLVLLPQFAGWICRVVSMREFLVAFGVHASVRNDLLVLVVGSLSTVLPFTPGGVGTQQALIVVVLAGAASRPDLLGFSVGMQFAITAFNILLGILALGLTLRHLSVRRAIADARAAQAAESRVRV